MKAVLCLCVLTLVISESGISEKQSLKSHRGTNYNELEDELLNVSTFDDKENTDLDSAGSWLHFVKRSDKRRQKGKKQSKRSKNTLPGLRGPPGPIGPRGPRGPPGAVVTQDVLLREFREMVRVEAERRAEQLLAVRCPGCRKQMTNDTSLFITFPWDDELTVVPAIKAGFHSRIKDNMVVSRRKFLELKNYQMPFGGGAFERGHVFNPDEGRFTAPVDGIYQFTTALHIGIPRTQTKRRMNRRENVRVLICINSLCQKHTSLSFTSGLESNSKLFTIHVSGLLQLEAKQYTSVFVDNCSKATIVIQSGSDFTGVLSGV